MAQARLRIYYGPPDDGGAATLHEMPAAETVTVSAGEIFPLLAEALQSERTWLKDFKDDEITISADLYEVVLAYQHCRRPPA